MACAALVCRREGPTWPPLPEAICDRCVHGMCYFASRGNFAAAVTNGRRRRRGGRPSLGKAGAARGHAIRRPCVKTRSKTAVLLASSIKSVAVRCASTPDLLYSHGRALRNRHIKKRSMEFEHYLLRNGACQCWVHARNGRFQAVSPHTHLSLGASLSSSFWFFWFCSQDLVLYCSSSDPRATPEESTQSRATPK